MPWHDNIIIRGLIRFGLAAFVVRKPLSRGGHVNPAAALIALESWYKYFSYPGRRTSLLKYELNELFMVVLTACLTQSTVEKIMETNRAHPCRYEKILVSVAAMGLAAYATFVDCQMKLSSVELESKEGHPASLYKSGPKPW